MISRRARPPVLPLSSGYLLARVQAPASRFTGACHSARGRRASSSSALPRRAADLPSCGFCSVPLPHGPARVAKRPGHQETPCLLACCCRLPCRPCRGDAAAQRPCPCAVLLLCQSPPLARLAVRLVSSVKRDGWMIRPFLSESAARSLSKTNQPPSRKKKIMPWSRYERSMLLLFFQKYSV
jgi:hypothetical protein